MVRPLCGYVGDFVCFNSICLYMDDMSGLTIFLCTLYFIVKNLPINFLSAIDTSGYCKTGSMNLIFYSLYTSYSRDGIIHSSFEMECISITFISLLLNTLYIILVVLCFLYMEDGVIMDSSILSLTTSQRRQSACAL